MLPYWVTKHLPPEEQARMRRQETIGLVVTGVLIAASFCALWALIIAHAFGLIP